MRDVKRVLFSVAFALACQLVVVAVAFGGPFGRRGQCQCQAGGQCSCGTACQCAAADMTLTMAAVTSEDKKSGPPAAVASPPQTYHLETQCTNGRCTTVMVPDSAPPPIAGPACSAAACAPKPRFARLVGYAITHPFGGFFRRR